MSSFFCGGTMMASGAMLQLEGSVKYMLWGGIGFYVVLVLLIGYLSGRKVKNVQDFLVAGRRLPMWMATATLLATWFGAGSSMGVAATVYSGGIRDVLADPFGASVSLILAGIFLVGILRKMNHMTVTDVIQSRFGAGPAIYASFWMIPVYVGWLGSQVLGLGVILNLLTGVDLLTAQLIGAAVVGCLVIVFVSFPSSIVSWFMKDRDVVANTLKIALVSYPFSWVYVLLEVNGGAVRGMGYTFYSMIAVIMNMCVLRVSLLAIFSRVFHTIESLGACYPITWATAAVSFLILFHVIIGKKIREHEEPAQA